MEQYEGYRPSVESEIVIQVFKIPKKLDVKMRQMTQDKIHHRMIRRLVFGKRHS